MPYKDVVIVNEQDEVIGSGNLKTAIKHNQIRRVARIFVVNETSQFLIQKRSQYVNHAGRYDVSAGGHVDVGESYTEAATRELREELGITIDLPDPCITSYRSQSEYSFCTFYIIHIMSDLPITFDPHEIELVTWKTKKEINAMIKTDPHLFTTAFIESWALVSPSI
jgi:isopentenyldiphosphate isomerase